MYKSVGF